MTSVTQLLLQVSCATLFVICTCKAEDDGKMVVLNPLQRALMELRDAYAKPTGKNLCDANKAILAECHVCGALEPESPIGGDACCVSVDAFAQCHVRVLQLMDEIEELEKNVIKPQYEEGKVEESDMPSKRYGNLMTNWFGEKDKRYGNLYGNFGKRYGNLMGNTFGKRYGNLYGGLFGGSDRDKRYGYTFGNLFKKFRKSRN